LKQKTGRQSDDRFMRGPLEKSRYASDVAREAYAHLKRMEGDGDNDDALISQKLESTIALENPGRGFLFNYQHDLVSRIITTVTSSPPGNIGLVTLPTGGGKTRTAVWGVLELVRSGHLRRTLWLAPSRELLDQAVMAFRSVWQVLPASETLHLVRCHAGGRPRRGDASVVFMTPQMLHRRSEKNREILRSYELIVFDEAHHAIAPTFKEPLANHRPLAVSLIGLSATPGRRTEEGTESLVDLFRGRLITSDALGPEPVKALQARGVLARLVFRTIDVGKEWPGLVVRRQGEGRPLRELETDLHRFDAVIATCLSIAQKEKAIVFAGGIGHANAIAATLRGQGVPANAISSETPVADREKILQDFSYGLIRVLVNKNILATGYDCPSVSHVVLGVPIGSPILFEQIVGRVSRGPEVGGTRTGYIWQVDDNLHMNGYPASYYRFRDYDWTGRE